MPRIALLALALVAACQPSARPTERSASPNLADRCPVGDGVNVSVYDFIEREMAAHTRIADRAEIRAEIAAERAISGPDVKPRRASIIESQLSHILGTLCEGTPGCAGVGVYDRNGEAIGLSTPHTPVYGFDDDARWAALTAATEDGSPLDLPCPEAQAAGLQCDGKHGLVAFPVREQGTLLGVATCIVEK